MGVLSGIYLVFLFLTFIEVKPRVVVFYNALLTFYYKLIFYARFPNSIILCKVTDFFF